MAGSVSTSHEMGLHEEQLAGRTQQMYFSATEEENYTYPWAYEVDFAKKPSSTRPTWSIAEINVKIRELMQSGHGTITVQEPARQALARRRYPESPESEFRRFSSVTSAAA